MNKKIKFLHIADLHLDTPFKSVGIKDRNLQSKLKKATFQSLERLIDIALKEQVDFVLIVGDSFNEENPSVGAQLFLREQLQRLTDQSIKVFINYGNHDFLSKKRLVDLDTQVYQFTKETIDTIEFNTKENISISLSSFSYTRPHINERLIQNFPSRSQQTDFHIGMLHGQVDDFSNQYAPFTIQEINQKQYDYFALGHVHKKSILQNNPPIIYPGNIQGLNRKETGEKGGYLVILEENELPQLQFIQTATIIFEELVLHVTRDKSAIELIEEIKSYYHDNYVQLFTIYWEIDADVDKELLLKIEKNELSDALNNSNHFIIKNIIHIKSKQKVFLQEEMQKLYLQILENNEKEYEKVIIELLTNTKVQTLFPTLNSDMQLKEEIMQRSKTIIVENIEGS